jgi:ABC-2 type transport system ATP-binding protein
MALPASVPEEPIKNQMALTEPPVIDLHGLSVTFGHRPILKNLRGDLRGRAIGLLGPNGAGKTTLIHTLLGFHAPSAGTAHIFETDSIVDWLHARARLVHRKDERSSLRASDG